VAEKANSNGSGSNTPSPTVTKPGENITEFQLVAPPGGTRRVYPQPIGPPGASPDDGGREGLLVMEGMGSLGGAADDGLLASEEGTVVVLSSHPIPGDL
jgi:hypothetical protein